MDGYMCISIYLYIQVCNIICLLRIRYVFLEPLQRRAPIEDPFLTIPKTIIDPDTTGHYDTRDLES